MKKKETYWYVVRAVTGKELKVKELLEKEAKKNGIDSLLEVKIPQAKTMQTVNGKPVIKEMPSMGGYMFINVQGEIKHTLAELVRSIPNVVGFLGAEKGRKPEPMSDRDVAAAFAESPAPADIGFSVGDKVRIKEGPFDGFDAVIESCEYVKNKVSVATLMFGRTTKLDLHMSSVELVSKG